MLKLELLNPRYRPQLPLSSVAYPDLGPGAFLTPGSGMNKKKSRSGSEDRDIPDHISENLETFFGLKILKLFDADKDPGSEIFLTLDDP